jgi:hypothetical protein
MSSLVRIQKSHAQLGREVQAIFLSGVIVSPLLDFKTWRKRVGVEPTDDGVTRRPPVLKTGRFTGTHALPEKKQTKNEEQIRTADLLGE